MAASVHSACIAVAVLLAVAAANVPDSSYDYDCGHWVPCDATPPTGAEFAPGRPRRAVSGAPEHVPGAAPGAAPGSAPDAIADHDVDRSGAPPPPPRIARSERAFANLGKRRHRARRNTTTSSPLTWTPSSSWTPSSEWTPSPSATSPPSYPSAWSPSYPQQSPSPSTSHRPAKFFNFSKFKKSTTADPPPS